MHKSTLPFLTDDVTYFPSIPSSNHLGIFAQGGDLSPERLSAAYVRGVFPFYSLDLSDNIEWACPADRFVLFPNEIHISHSMRTIINQNKFEISFNEACEHVIKSCATVDNRHLKFGSWLDMDMIEAYMEMHRLGKVQSVEVWENDILVGGLYGVTLKGCFFGESMFSNVPNGSKIALIALAKTMERNGGKMIDCQYETAHLKSMGGRHISYNEYIEIINRQSPSEK